MKQILKIACPKCARRISVDLKTLSCPNCDATPKQLRKAIIQTLADGYIAAKQEFPKAKRPIKITEKLDDLLNAISADRKEEETKKRRESDMRNAKAFKHLILEEAMELWLAKHPEYRK